MMDEEAVYGETAVGNHGGGGGMQPIQDQGPQMEVPHDLNPSLQVHDRKFPDYTGKDHLEEPFFRVRDAKAGQAKSPEQFRYVDPKTVPVPTPPVPTPPADMVQPKFAEAMEEGSPTPVSPTTLENLNVSLRQPEQAGCPITVENLNVQVRQQELARRHIYPEQPYASDKYLHGQVVPGTKSSVTTLLDDLKDLSLGTHGVFIDKKTCQTSQGRYEEQEHFIVNRKLGQGANGIVDLCTDTTTRGVFVRKKLPDKTCLSRREVDVLKGLKHKNIAQFKGFILREGKPEIYLEYGGLALNKLISDPGRYEQLVTDHNVARLAKQGLEALHFLDMRGILHLDVKPENLVLEVGPPLKLKLTDFGSCKAPQDPLQFQGWTPEYMSPEACSLYVMYQPKQLAPPSNALTGKTDVYAFGATIACLRYGFNPLRAFFMQNKSVEQYMKKERIKIIFMLDKCPEFMYKLARQIPTLTECERELLAKLLAGDANDRYSAKEALDFVLGKMLPQFVPQPARLLAPSAGVCEEAMSPQPACPAPCQPIEEEEEPLEEDLEIDVRAGKQRGPIQTATPETSGADAMSRVAGQTGQALVFEDTPTTQLTNAVAPNLAFSISTKSPDVSKDSSAVPTTAAPAGNFGVTNYKVPAGNSPATFGDSLVSGKGSSKSGRGTMPGKPPQQKQQQSLGKMVQNRNRAHRQKSCPYNSDNRSAVASKLPNFSELLYPTPRLHPGPCSLVSES